MTPRGPGSPNAPTSNPTHPQAPFQLLGSRYISPGPASSITAPAPPHGQQLKVPPSAWGGGSWYNLSRSLGQRPLAWGSPRVQSSLARGPRAPLKKKLPCPVVGQWPEPSSRVGLLRTEGEPPHLAETNHPPPVTQSTRKLGGPQRAPAAFLSLGPLMCKGHSGPFRSRLAGQGEWGRIEARVAPRQFLPPTSSERPSLPLMQRTEWAMSALPLWRPFPLPGCGRGGGVCSLLPQPKAPRPPFLRG